MNSLPVRMLPENSDITRWHREALIGCSLVLLTALMLDVRPDQRVAIRGLSCCPLPQVCPSRTWAGIDCPACGLTRSIVHLAHGQFTASWQSHRLGWLMGGILLLQIPYRCLVLHPNYPLSLAIRTEVWLGFALVTLLLSNWLFSLMLQVAQVNLEEARSTKKWPRKCDISTGRRRSGRERTRGQEGQGTSLTSGWLPCPGGCRGVSSRTRSSEIIKYAN